MKYKLAIGFVFVCFFLSQADFSAEEYVWSQLDSIKPVYNDSRVRAVHSIVVYWAEKVISEGYSEPAESRYIMIPATDREQMDLARISYTVGENLLTITQSQSFFFITIEGDSFQEFPVSSNEVESSILSLAQAIFNGGKNLKISDVKQGEKGSLGTITTAEEPDNKHPWLNYVVWKWNDGVVSFAFIKNSGRLSSASLGWNNDDNQGWFFSPRK